MKTLKFITLSVVALFALNSCSEAWRMDYGEPAAQFNEADVLEKAPKYIGKKISIKGKLIRMDLTDPQKCMVYLDYGIACNFGHFKAMAEEYKVGDTVFVDGILKRCAKDDILLKPAMGRDPTAKFEPLE